jgi:hypothetical protein
LWIGFDSVHKTVYLWDESRYLVFMSSVAEIEDAIRSLPAKDRAQLVADLPSILPELDGDAEWERIIGDESKRETLSKIGDEIEAELKRDPSTFPELHPRDFDQHS